MTLVELLVVLAILAVLATVAVTSADALLSQGRYEATQRTLTNIEEAVLGPANARQPDGTILVSGFVADLGRLPQAVATPAPVTGLPVITPAELWSPGALLPFAIRRAADPAPSLPSGTADPALPISDPEVLVPCGWRGPYLRLLVGQLDVRDGWGRWLVLLNNSGNAAATGDAIAGIQSLGSDGLADSAGGGSGGYDRDVLLTFANRWQMKVGGSVYILDSGVRRNPKDTDGTVRVILYGPNPGTGGVLETPLQVTPSSPTGDNVVSYDSAGTPVAIGPRVLRAYVGDTASPRKSNIVRFQQSDAFDLVIQ